VELQIVVVNHCQCDLRRVPLKFSDRSAVV